MDRPGAGLPSVEWPVICIFRPCSPSGALLIEEGLNSADRAEFWRAEQAARTLGIDSFDHILARIDADPLEGPWFQAWQGADSARARILTERASRLIDLTAIATGPANTTGMGPEFRAHMALNWTLQGLRDHPGFGTELVTAALQSPSIQNRNGALNVLEAWGFDRWPDDHRHHLSVMATSDPVTKVRERANELVRHRPSKHDPGAQA